MTAAVSALVGDSPAMQRLRALIVRVAPARIPVLIDGETGSGKELVAAELHRLSGRTGAFVAFNVCALGESMFEDALFGHARGAYTGAVGESMGFLREANGGSVFLDEISGLATPLQAKLLRAIEAGVFRPIGSARDARSDFRTIAATNERLSELVADGRFRADLAYRLSGIVIPVPSLRERTADIPILAQHFADRARSGGLDRVGRPSRAIVLTKSAARLLQEREWPGNVRELRQAVEAAMIFAGDVLDVDAFEEALRHRPSTRSPMTVSDDRIDVERERLLELLASVSWNTDRLASHLGVHRATVYRRAKRLGIRLRSRGAAWLDEPHVH